MRFRLRTLLIVLALMACHSVALYCALPYAKPLAETASDYFVERVARVVYRDAGCNLMLD
jgi:hypothetical protein